MKTFFLIVVAVIFMLLSLPVLFGDRKYKRAKSLERRGKYKDACYEYAIAILNGSLAERECRKRIKNLWEKYGPFDYSDILKEIEKDDTPEKCGAVGHAATISIIEEIVSIK